MHKHDNPFVIPKSLTIVDISLNDGTKHIKKYLIHLNEVSKLGTGKETIREFLETNCNSFIPTRLFNSETNTTFVILSVDNICYIRDFTPINEIVDVKNEVSVVFINGIKQKIAMSPKIQNFDRIIDYLNAPGKFKEFVSYRTHVYVNKEHIVKIIEEG